MAQQQYGLLSQSQVSGVFSIQSGPLMNNPTVVVRMPERAQSPAVLTVKNMDAGAVMSLRWINSTGQGGGSGVATVNPGDCPIRLEPGVSYTWDSPPRNAFLVCVSTVAGALLGVDGNWTIGAEQ